MIGGLQRALGYAVCVALSTFAAPLWAGADDIATLLAQGHTATALALSDAWLAQHPDAADVRFLRGRALAALGHTDAAIDAFRSLIESEPDNPGPANNLAVLYARAGKYEQARRWLETAMQTNASYAIAHRNLGDVYTSLAGLAYRNVLQPRGQPQDSSLQLEMVTRLHPRPAATAATGPAHAARVIPAPTPIPEPATPPDAPPPKPATPQASADVPPETRAEILAALDAWAQAWAAQDVGAYLNAYAEHFNPEDDLSLAVWRETRRERLSAPAYIEVRIDDAVVTLWDTDTASVVFEQTYNSDTYNDRVHKTIVMTRTTQGWRIVSETHTRL